MKNRKAERWTSGKPCDTRLCDNTSIHNEAGDFIEAAETEAAARVITERYNALADAHDALLPESVRGWVWHHNLKDPHYILEGRLLCGANGEGDNWEFGGSCGVCGHCALKREELEELEE